MWSSSPKSPTTTPSPHPARDSSWEQVRALLDPTKPSFATWAALGPSLPVRVLKDTMRGELNIGARWLDFEQALLQLAQVGFDRVGAG